MRRSRKSGLKSKNPNAGSKFKEGLEPEPIDISYDSCDNAKDVGELSDLMTSLNTRILRKQKEHFYMVTYVDEPNLLYLSLSTTVDQAKGEATKYFKNFHPNFSGRQWRTKYLACRRRKMHVFDKYVKLGAVPIRKVMEQGGKFPCSICGEDMFSYQDYEDGRCFVLENEGEILPHINGYVFCYKCKQKHLH